MKNIIVEILDSGSHLVELPPTRITDTSKASIRFLVLGSYIITSVLQLPRTASVALNLGSGHCRAWTTVKSSSRNADAHMAVVAAENVRFVEGKFTYGSRIKPIRR
jgi:hypothetical protein